MREIIHIILHSGVSWIKPFFILNIFHWKHAFHLILILCNFWKKALVFPFLCLLKAIDHRLSVRHRVHIVTYIIIALLPVLWRQFFHDPPFCSTISCWLVSWKLILKLVNHLLNLCFVNGLLLSPLCLTFIQIYIWVVVLRISIVDLW